MLREVEREVKEAPTLTPQNEWVSVYDRLPEPGERVLATDCGFVGEFYINKRGKWQRYTTATRGGCWFCHNQSVGQLRFLRKNHPDLWALMLKWDADSPVTFKADGHTVHDYDRRFALEDDGMILPDEPFRWAMLDEELNYRWF